MNGKWCENYWCFWNSAVLFVNVMVAAWLHLCLYSFRLVLYQFILSWLQLFSSHEILIDSVWQNFYPRINRGEEEFQGLLMLMWGRVGNKKARLLGQSQEGRGQSSVFLSLSGGAAIIMTVDCVNMSISWRVSQEIGQTPILL